MVERVSTLDPPSSIWNKRYTSNNKIVLALLCTPPPMSDCVRGRLCCCAKSISFYRKRSWERRWEKKRLQEEIDRLPFFYYYYYYYAKRRTRSFLPFFFLIPVTIEEEEDGKENKERESFVFVCWMVDEGSSAIVFNCSCRISSNPFPIVCTLNWFFHLRHNNNRTTATRSDLVAWRSTSWPDFHRHFGECRAERARHRSTGAAPLARQFTLSGFECGCHYWIQQQPHVAVSPSPQAPPITDTTTTTTKLSTPYARHQRPTRPEL